MEIIKGWDKLSLDTPYFYYFMVLVTEIYG